MGGRLLQSEMVNNAMYVLHARSFWSIGLLVLGALSLLHLHMNSMHIQPLKYAITPLLTQGVFYTE